MRLSFSTVSPLRFGASTPYRFNTAAEMGPTQRLFEKRRRPGSTPVMGDASECGIDAPATARLRRVPGSRFSALV